MELIEIQVSATVALLLGHFIVVVWNRMTRARRTVAFGD
jgi:hypothetical protein